MPASGREIKHSGDVPVVISSMTGFARIDGSEDGYSWAWEVKSVNSRGLDLRFRVPPGFDQIEATARKVAGARFSRGNLSVNLTIQRPESAPKVQINHEILDQIVSLVRGYRGDTPPDIETLLGLKGVLDFADEGEPDEAGLERRKAMISKDFEQLSEALGNARDEEGARLQTVVEEHLDSIAALTAAAALVAEMQPEQRSKRLKMQLGELLDADTPVSEDRLAQEIALIVARGDIREELDRLVAHTESARELIGEGGAIGRRLDFLCQEFNREANTLCSKAADLELTRIGLDLKAAIERLREQIQNIE